MTNEVDLAWASNQARECADRALVNCYPVEQHESSVALSHWARVFRYEFESLTKPSSIAWLSLRVAPQPES
jgi:hypothetical protein